MGVEMARTKRKASRDGLCLLPWCECEDDIAFFFERQQKLFFCEGRRRRKNNKMKIKRAMTNREERERVGRVKGQIECKEKTVERKIDRQEKSGQTMHHFPFLAGFFFFFFFGIQFGYPINSVSRSMAPTFTSRRSSLLLPSFLPSLPHSPSLPLSISLSLSPFSGSVYFFLAKLNAPSLSSP